MKKKIASLFAVLLLLKGCALTEPYKPIVSTYEKEVELRTKDQNAKDIDKAINHARTAQLELLTFVKDRHNELAMLSNAQFLIGGTLITDAAIDFSRDLTIIGSVLGATSMSMAQFNDDPRRPVLFIDAINAINCGINVVSPLKSIDEISFQTFSYQSGEPFDPKGHATNETGIKVAIDQLSYWRTALFLEKTALQIYLTDDNLTENERKLLEQLILVADTAYGHSKIVLNTATELEAKYNDADEQLIKVVHNVINLLAKGIALTSKDFGEVTAQLQGLVLASSSFSGLPVDHLFNYDFLSTASTTAKDPESLLSEEGTRPDEGEPEGKVVSEQPYFDTYTQLVNAVANAKSVMEQLDAKLSAVKQLQSSESLETCNLDISEALPAMTITPPTPLVFDAKNGGKNGFTILGGNKFYKATLLGEPEGITISQNGFSEYVNISVEPNKATPGTYRVEVKDTAGSVATALVVIKASAPSQGQPPKAKQDESNNCQDNKELCELQQTLAWFDYLTPKDVDGLCGDTTRKRWKAFQQFVEDSPYKQIDCNDKNQLTKANMYVSEGVVSFLDNLKGKQSEVTDKNFDTKIAKANQGVYLTWLLESHFNGSPFNADIKADGKLTDAELDKLGENEVLTTFLKSKTSFSPAELSDISNIEQILSVLIEDN